MDCFEGFAQQGWQCPICRRVYSPSTPMCYYCGNEETVTTTSYNFTIDKKKEIIDGWMAEQLKNGKT